jgi:hypothetical protein
MQAYSKNLFVAWELGCQGAVEEMFQDITEKCHIDADGNLVVDRHTRLDDMETFRLLPLIGKLSPLSIKPRLSDRKSVRSYRSTPRQDAGSLSC